MREMQAWAGALMTAALTVAGLSGCQTSSDAGGERPGQGGRSARPSGYGAEFLAVDECSSTGTTSFTEVPCTSEGAAARVIARHDGALEQGRPCPATTDFVLNISESTPAADGDKAVAQGYACMRNLEPPHPGDPGGGGGPLTIVGDCVYGAGGGEVRETACDGRGAHAPEYKVTSAVAQRSQCPESTALYVQLGGDKPVGCARPV